MIVLTPSMGSVHLVSKVLIIFALIGIGAASGQPVPPRRISVPAAKVARTRIAPSQLFRLGAAPAVNLGPIAPNVRNEPTGRPGVRRVGAQRTVRQVALGTGTWQPVGDGTSVWQITFKSDNALGIRVHFTDFDAAAGQVWVHDLNTPAAQVFGPFTGKGRNGNGDFWTEVVFSDSVEVEYRPAASQATSGLPPFTVAEVLHLWELGPFQAASASAAGAGTGSASCLLDATCSSTNPVVASESGATALLLFGAFECSGTILNAPSGAPVLMTAGHCISTQADAQGMEAFFNVRTAICGANSDTRPPISVLARFPYAVGKTLLSYSNLPFANGTNPTEVASDLDYSLIQLTGFPTGGEVTLAGYDPADDVATASAVTSLSFPDGYYMQVAFGTVVAGSQAAGSYFMNAYEVDMSADGQGRVDEGSSGSGLFNPNNLMVGVLSTIESCPNPLPDGSCPIGYTSCQAQLPFDAWYTKFSAIYPSIEVYLDNPLPGTPAPEGTFTASPNPIMISNGDGLGVTTLSYSFPTVPEVQVRVGSPGGAALSDGPGVGQAVTGHWVQNGTIFYLQNVSGGLPLTAANTLAAITVYVEGGTASLTANPSAIPLGAYQATTLTWQAPGSWLTEIRVGSPGGPAFSEGGSTGSATTGVWATAETTFYLLDFLTQTVIASTTIQPTGGVQSTITASPNPIPVAAGQLGTTTLQWYAPLATLVEVHVGSPTGPLFTRNGNEGSATTGAWVTNGMTFYLQNVTDGLPLASANTLATVTVALAQQ
ncbi:MAG TPA: trypsin-like peptidase domain-containing protein [Bryobacteraceae bacterium]|nr:trypsin-like peptidase domain-containing protein [Bryobacteraceae bacterium]